MRKILTMMFVFLLMSCGSPWALFENAQPGDVLYRESFSDPTNGWDRYTTEVGTQDYYDGTYRIIVNKLDYDLWGVTGRNYSDIRLEVNGTRLGGPVENRFGLICRYHNALDFYFFVISSDGYFTIGKVSGGTLSLLGQPMMAYNGAILTGGTPNHLRFDCVGNTLTGYVNGQMVAITQDTAFTHGKVGLIAGSFASSGVDVVFDDFLVIKP